MKRHHTQKIANKIKPIACAVALATAANASIAQEAVSPVKNPHTLILEEILVTAQKRIESLQEVPLSIVALSGEKLDQAGVEDLHDLTAHMPNLHFTETGIGTQVRIRGIGSENSQGFEQSVGMYVDGIYHGRAQLFRTPLFDMERAELLRGPQGTLFGKNSIAGALNITTARPADDFEASASLMHSPDTEKTELSGYVSYPFSDVVKSRLAVRYNEYGGYVENTYKGDNEPSKEELAIRASVLFDINDDFNILVSAEQNNFDWKGRAIEIVHDESLTEGGPTYSQAVQGAVAGLEASPISGLLGTIRTSTFESDKDFKRQANADEYSNNEVSKFTVNANYDFNDHTLTSVTGLLNYSSDELCDCDYTPINIMEVNLDEEYDQFSQELRIASPTGQQVEWIAGVYYQSYEQTFQDQLDLRNDEGDANLLTELVYARTFNPGTGSGMSLRNSGIRRNFTQDSESWAVFGSTTLHFTDYLRLTIGARYTEEEKESTKVVNVVENVNNGTGGEISNSGLLGFAYMSLFRTETEQAPTGLPLEAFGYPAGWTLADGGHNISGSRTESAVTPKFNLQIDASDNSMIYFSFEEGFKAGGFDPRSNVSGDYDKRVQPNPDFTYTPPEEKLDPRVNYEFEEEHAKASELGMKNTLWDGRLDFNIAFYHTEYEDLQFSQFDGGVGFNVGNVDATVKGVEIDGRVALMDGLTWNYAYAYLDFKYGQFDFANCSSNPDANRPGQDGFCDLSGEGGLYAPEFTINTSFDYRRMLGDMEFISFVDLQYVEEQKTHVNHDPIGNTNAYTLIGARVALETEHWGFALVGKNLKDEKVITYSGNAPLSDSTFGTNTHYAFMKEGRTLGAEVKFKF